jgi:hypothetical protein
MIKINLNYFNFICGLAGQGSGLNRNTRRVGSYCFPDGINGELAGGKEGDNIWRYGKMTERETRFFSGL